MQCFKNQKGLTLLEMLVSLAVLSITVAVIVQSVGFNVMSTVFVGEKGQANAIAAKEMQRITAIIKTAIGNSAESSEILSQLENDDNYVSYEELYAYSQDLEPRFFVQEATVEFKDEASGEDTAHEYYEIIVTVFYRNGQAYIELPVNIYDP